MNNKPSMICVCALITLSILPISTGFTMDTMGNKSLHEEPVSAIGFNSEALIEYPLIEHIVFQTPDISQGMISMEECANILAENKPVIPCYQKNYVFPAGSSLAIQIDPVDPVILNYPDVVLPASPILPAPGYSLIPGSYDTDMTYPPERFTYDIKGGIVEGEHKTILTVYLYPLQYQAGKLVFVNEYEIQIDQTAPIQPLFTGDAYDLLVVTPEAWITELEPFIQHKESHGVTTKVVSLNEIYTGHYFSSRGRDDAEKIKYFIKDALENWGTLYVLLVGGRIPGVQESWFTPVRYAHIARPLTGSNEVEHQYVSDLYFADIYDGMYNFSSWDTDGNNVFSEWENGFGKKLQDDMDLYPDVYLGRWACRNKLELKWILEKTIQYENSRGSNTLVLVGGDNFEPDGFEGEIVGDKTAEYLPGYATEKIYASQMDVTASAIKEAVNANAAFIHLHGHASPMSWSTHKPENFDVWEKGIDIFDLPFFFNTEYPIAVIGGCHTAMFNVSMTIHPWAPPVPEGLGWWLARKYQGGAIATLGYSAFPVATPGESGDLDGDGINDPDCIESGYGYMQLEFFKAYGVQGYQYLGECWQYAVSSYIDHFKIPYLRYHLNTLQGFVILGDPSLKIAGYP